MHRFLASFPLRDKFSLSTGDIFHQITRVFRAKKGDKMIFFTSGGMDIVYEVLESNKDELLFKKYEEIQRNRKNTLNLHVFQAYPNKIATMEVIVQKLVEIGVKKITFFPGEHSQIQGIPVQKQKRISSIAREALEQSGGNEITDISYTPEKLREIMSRQVSLNHIVAHQSGSILQPLAMQNNPLALWIWPEGGWSSSETDFLEEQKILLWSFNDNILRLETAAILWAGLLFYNQNVE